MKISNFNLLLLLFAFLFIFLFQLANSSRDYYVISLDQNIDMGAQNFIYRTIDDAISKNSKFYVIVLNTFGGYVIHMDNIVKKIQEAESKGLKVITLIAPIGAHATSAGAFIALASTEIYMAKGTSIGSATPVMGTVDESTKRKVINAFAKYIESLAEAKDKNKTAAKEMVTLGKSYTAEEAFKLNLIDGLINSTTVEGALKELGIEKFEIVKPDVASQFLSFLSSPEVASFLSLLGFFALIYGLASQSEISIAAALAAFILSFISFAIISPFIGAILLILIGGLLIVIELKIGEGIAAIPGGIIIALGFLLLYVPITIPEFEPGKLPNLHFFNIGISQYVVAITIAFLGSIFGIYAYKMAQTIKKRSAIMDVSKLMNKTGFALSEISPEKSGVVNVEAEEWTAESDEFIPKGSKIKVIGIRKNILKVKKYEE